MEELDMLISTKGRYALRVMIDLAEHQGQGFIPLKEVARRQEISEKYLESIIKLLVRGKLLGGLRGKGGGYQLSRAPESYIVGDILRLTEETLAPVACLSPDSEDCPRAGFCKTLPMWRGLDRVISEYLNGFTLQDLVQTEPAEGSSQREEALC
jgi:Rrf2 family protein